MKVFPGKTFLALLLIIAACQGKKNKKIDPVELRFTTTQGSELFFRNVRLPYYTELDSSGKDLSYYMLEKPDITGSRPEIQAVLIIDRKQNLAWLDVAVFNYPGSPGEVIIQWEATGDGDTDQGQIHFFELTRNKSMEAVEIYNHLNHGHSFYLIDNKKIPVLAEDGQRKTFRRTVMDFLRLTGSL